MASTKTNTSPISDTFSETISDEQQRKQWRLPQALRMLTVGVVLALPLLISSIPGSLASSPAVIATHSASHIAIMRPRFDWCPGNMTPC